MSTKEKGIEEGKSDSSRRGGMFKKPGRKKSSAQRRNRGKKGKPSIKKANLLPGMKGRERSALQIGEGGGKREYSENRKIRTTSYVFLWGEGGGDAAPAASRKKRESTAKRIHHPLEERFTGGDPLKKKGKSRRRP